jgi:glycosyltransferase involved in cell wall biosynthesis
MKVLIITYYWPPSGGSGVQRWLKFVKYLRDFDIEPIVYTVDNPAYAIEDDSLLEEIPIDLEILKQKIWEPNNLLGTRKNTSAGFLNPRPTFFGQIAHYIRANYFIPDARKYWVKPSVAFLKAYLEKSDIDLIITTGPPHSLHLIGLELKKTLAIKWIADFRDPWTEIDYFHQLPLTKKSIAIHKELEKEVIQNADAVVVVGNTMKLKMEALNKNIHVITNGFDDVISEGPTILDKNFTITHIGMMNADRNPKLLWEVLKNLVNENDDFKENLQLKLVGKIDPVILEDIQFYGLEKYVSVIDYLPHKEVIQLQKTSQLLLLVVNNVPSAKGIITGKIFEYLHARRPVLAIAPEDGDLAEIIKTTNSGEIVNFDDKDLLRSVILDFFKRYKKGDLKVSSDNIEQFHRKNLTKKLAGVIVQTLDDSGGESYK